jgi:hypothetical protein
MGKTNLENFYFISGELGPIDLTTEPFFMRAQKDIEGEWTIRGDFIRKPAMSKITLDLDQVIYLSGVNR